MVLPQGIDEIGVMLVEELATTKFACKAVIPLGGGTANFIFEGQLDTPLSDGISEVLIKHGEDFVALNPNFKIPTSRCKFEETCVETLQELPPTTNTTCSVRTPRLLLSISETNTQIQEYLKGALNLKLYSLQYYPKGTPQDPLDTDAQRRLKLETNGIGSGLGKWLRHFHDWAQQPEQAEFRAQIQQNKDMQELKHTINYEWLVSNIEKYPSILEDAREIFEKVRGMAKAEIADEESLQIIHGDFWTGNALLPNALITEGTPAPIFIIDWEMSQLGVRPLDLGQMIAELLELYLFKGIRAALWIIEGFVSGYEIPSDAFAFRTLIHVGIHLINFGSSVPGWGTPEQVEDVVRIGRDIILKAWEEDKEGLREQPGIACLFGTSS